MKRLNSFLIGILISLNSFAFTPADSVKIPIYVLNGIVDELILKDGMEVMLNKKDSIITVYAHKDSVNRLKLREYKLNEYEYKQTLENIRELLKISEAEKKDLQRELRTIKRRAVLITVGNILLLIILL